MSSNSPHSSPPGGVSFQAELPIEWEPLVTAPGLDELAGVDARNRELLSALLLCDEAASEVEEEAQGEHWHRLDAKLDLVLSLLGELLLQQRGMPPARRLRLAGEWLAIEACPGEELPAIGERLRLRLYLSPRIPRPLDLLARVSEKDETGLVRLQFDAIADATRDLLERHVFRQHRRAVALARSVSPD